jgi:L-asparaginase II
VTVHVPDETFAGDVPLVAVMRGQYVGSLHRGTFAVCDVDGGTVLSAGDVSQRVFLRSAAKPFQVMPAVLSGAIDRFRLTQEETAVLCASHNAEPVHVAAVLSALGKAGLGEDALRCGAHAPLDAGAAADLVRSGQAPTAVCNNCSGAHTGMLLACVANGWPLERYGDPDHPLQRMTREIVATFAGVAMAEVQMATDNCAVPTFRLPVQSAARAFARLVSPHGLGRDLEAAAAIVTEAMTACPHMVAGEDRFDTDLMVQGRGSIVAKGGAEAFEGIGLIECRLGIALKISDGGSRATAPASMAVLDALHALSAGAREALTKYGRPEVLNARGERVGRIEPVFSIEEES